MRNQSADWLWQSPSIELGGAAALGSLVLRVSEAQSAVVNDSPVDCQSRRPVAPQSEGGRAIARSDVVVSLCDN